jgi:Cd2+/Zn2+-exporting ATPase
VKALFLALALTGNAGLWMAILADDGAALAVTLNALRILRFRNFSPHRVHE